MKPGQAGVGNYIDVVRGAYFSAKESSRMLPLLEDAFPCLGCPCYATERQVDSHCAPLDRPDLGPTQRQKCTSLIARTHTCKPNPGAVRFPEVVLFKEALCVPMYLIKYRHAATCNCTHCKLG